MLKLLSPRVAMALLALATLCVYANSFQGVFVFDDAAITENPTLKHLWPLTAVFLPDAKEIVQGATVAGRPLVNLSFAINYALGGLNPEGYHAVNLLIHLLAGLTLFGIIRRTLRWPFFKNRYAGRETALAFVVALLWLLHPLQTESVTYIIQRAESLAGLFYLLTLYLAIRGFEGNRGTWYVAATLSAIAGIATKEITASLPLIVLLYDRLYVSESFRAAIKKRRLFYGAMAMTWILLATLVLQAKGRGGTVGFGHGITSWEYARSQFQAIVYYLKLCFWPSPLVLDYGSELLTGIWWPQAILLFLLAMGTLVALRFKSAIGFLGAWFFLILAPSSSVVPVVTQIMAEHRMYLPLASVVVLCVLGADWIWITWRRGLTTVYIPALVVTIIATFFAWGTLKRNSDYHSCFGIWKDTEMKRPGSSRAHVSVALELAKMRKFDEASTQFRSALKINPENVDALCGLAAVLGIQGHFPEAIKYNRQAIQLKPDLALGYNSLGGIFSLMNNPEKAAQFFKCALVLKPNYAEAHFNLATVLVLEKKPEEAEAHFRSALQAIPENAEIQFNFGVLLVSQHKFNEAIQHYRLALQLNPGDPEIYTNLGNAYALKGDPAAAIEIYRIGLKLNPNDHLAQANLDRLLKLQQQ